MRPIPGDRVSHQHLIPGTHGVYISGLEWNQNQFAVPPNEWIRRTSSLPNPLDCGPPAPLYMAGHSSFFGLDDAELATGLGDRVERLLQLLARVRRADHGAQPCLTLCHGRITDALREDASLEQLVG